MTSLTRILPLLLWITVWSVGGWLIAFKVLRSRLQEQLFVGLGIGLILQLWLSNLFSKFMPVPLSFWAGALGTLLLAFFLSFPLSKKDFFHKTSVSSGQIISFVLIAVIFTAIGRGLSIFDDYQNLPAVSLMASGDIPPRFALDPNQSFGYHYILLLFASQIMRLASSYPWVALDIARGITLAIWVVLSYVWVRRMARSHIAGFFGTLFALFAGGARWMLLLLPQKLIETISSQITLIGSGLSTAPDLISALPASWQINGDGPIHFPFAYANSINIPAIMGHNGTGKIAALIIILLLLSYRRWRGGWRTGIVFTILLSALALGGEVAYGLFGLGLFAALFLFLAIKRSRKIPASFIPWIWVSGISLIIALLQGGVLTELMRGVVSGDSGTTHFTFGAQVGFPPMLVSAHLGRLSLVQPAQLFVALLEIGAVIFALPITVVWGWRMVKQQRWFEAALFGQIIVAAFMLFVQFEGSLLTATNRLIGGAFATLSLYAVPLFWVWAKQRSEQVEVALLGWGAVAVFGGVMFFGIEMIAIQKPVYASFVSDMDAKVASLYWDVLPADSLIFDPDPYRSPTIFGRYTNSSYTWYTIKPEWLDLKENPDLYLLRAAGYDYLYFDREYEKEHKALLRIPCAKTVYKIDGGKPSHGVQIPDSRTLMDISSCE